MKSNSITIYTIGHGRHAFADFLELLQKFEIAFLCDVRNFARSRWVQFNCAMLSENLRENGIGYEHLPKCDGKKIAKPDGLNYGIERILEIVAEVKLVKKILTAKEAKNAKKNIIFRVFAVEN